MKFRPAKQLLLLTFSLAGACIGIAHATDPIEMLKVCAKMTDRDARFACYDDLGQRVLNEESADEQPPQEPAVAEAGVVTAATGSRVATEATGAATESTVATEATGAATDVQSLPDHLGGTVFEKESAQGKFDYRGLVTSCKKGSDGRWYFFFESGQVWKQSNKSRRRFKECYYSVTITRDGFGYKMQIDGESSKIRIARKR